MMMDVGWMMHDDGRMMDVGWMLMMLMDDGWMMDG